MSNEAIPSPSFGNAYEALKSTLPGAIWMHGAVAFVTQSGVSLLRQILEDVGPPQTIRIVVRGAPISEPQAVLELSDLGADVRVVMGAAAPRFHPKLWVVRTSSETVVLAGSGNLTRGGLIDNDEQFELVRLPHRPTTPTGAPAKSNKAAADHLIRWRGFFDKGIPLDRARMSQAWGTWENQLQRRAEIRGELEQLDHELQQATVQPPNGHQEPARRDGDLLLSALTERPTVEGWMRKWFPDETTRDQIWNVLADTMQAADDDRGRGWAACAIHFSNHDRQPRLAVYCGVAQVLVVHSTRGVFLEVPPERIDAPAYASGVSTSQFPGTEVDEWGSRENLHPSVMIPAPYAMAAWQSGGQEAVVASIRWRSPEANDGQTAHWQFHCPALVDAVRRATGRPLRQPGYATSV